MDVGQAGLDTFCVARLAVPFKDQRHGALGTAGLVLWPLVWGADHLIGPEPFTSEVLTAWGGLCTSRGATWWARAF